MEVTNEQSQDKLVGIIKRQTDYTDEIILEKLKTHQNNVENILKEYHGVQEKKDTNSNISNNQKIFKSIREFF